MSLNGTFNSIKSIDIKPKSTLVNLNCFNALEMDTVDNNLLQDDMTNIDQITKASYLPA